MYKDIMVNIKEKTKEEIREIAEAIRKNIKGKRTTKRNIKRMRSRSPLQRGARYILLQPLLLM